MQVSVENTGQLERRMTIKVPAERVDSEIDTRLKQLAKRAKLPGFRPGKIPPKVVKQQFGSQVQQEVLEELLRSSYAEALTQEKLSPAGGPTIDPVRMEPGEGLEYTATFEVYPEVELKGLDAIEVKRPKAEVADSDIETMLDNLRRQRATHSPVERAAAKGDRVTVDFEGSIKGKPFEGNQGEDVSVVLGEGRMLADFEAALEGLTAGDEHAFELKFPKDYPAEEVAGKKAKFEVKVKEVAEQQLPELDAEFVKQLGLASGDVDELRAEIRRNMEKELGEALQRRTKEQVMEGLVAANPIELPTALVSEEIERLRHDALHRMGLGHGEDDKNAPDLPDELFEEQARKRVSLGLLLGEVIRSQELQPEEARLQETLNGMVGGYQQPEEALRAYRQNPQVMRQLEALVLENQAVDWLLEQAKVSDEPMTFEEVMNAAR